MLVLRRNILKGLDYPANGLRYRKNAVAETSNFNTN